MKPCLFCGEERFKTLFNGTDFDSGHETFRLTRCRKCGLTRTEPILTSQDLQRYYPAKYYGSSAAKFNPGFEKLLQVGNQRRAIALLRAIRTELRPQRAPRILDVGCGRGGFLKALASRGAKCWGTELPGFDFPAPIRNIHWMHGELSEFQFENEFFDAVSMWHVLEHLPDPGATIAEVARVLRPGGILSLAVPNFGGWQSRIFKLHWFHLDLPRHQYHFSRKTLSAMLRKHGLRLESHHTFSVSQNLYGMLQSTLNAALGQAPNQLYFQLKTNAQRTPCAAMAGHLALSAVAAPAMGLATGFFALAGQGATLVVQARKKA